MYFISFANFQSWWNSLKYKKLNILRTEHDFFMK